MGRAGQRALAKVVELVGTSTRACGNSNSVEWLCFVLFCFGKPPDSLGHSDWLPALCDHVPVAMETPFPAAARAGGWVHGSVQ
jgi:hypothetical protein